MALSILQIFICPESGDMLSMSLAECRRGCEPGPRADSGCVKQDASAFVSCLCWKWQMQAAGRGLGTTHTVSEFASPLILTLLSSGPPFSSLFSSVLQGGTYPSSSPANHRSLGPTGTALCWDEAAGEPKNGAWDWVLGTGCCSGCLRKVSSLVSFVCPLFPHTLLLHQGKTESNNLFDSGANFGY